MAPTMMEPRVGTSPSVTMLEPVTQAAVTVTTVGLTYVGDRVGDTVGALLGEAEGCGVGLSNRNVGDIVGSAVGASVGGSVGCGVGTKKR